MIATDGPVLGRWVLTGSSTNLSLRCNALAWDNNSYRNSIYVLSVAGASTTIKAMAAALQSNSKITFNLQGVSGISTYATFMRGLFEYNVHRAKIAENTWHLLAIARDTQLLTSMDDNSLWALLRREAITTPMLRCWVPYIAEKLREGSYLSPLHGFGCSAGLLRANTEVIDKIVTEGVRDGSLCLRN